jgi:hypothetical protein
LLNDLKLNYIQALERVPKLLRIINELLSNELIPCDVSDYNVNSIELFTSSSFHHEKHLNDFRK